ncbi:MAG: cytochrome-c peroxidase [Deltaproteobacteria bacterium]|nr:cytochrome-c peroxidase [Deltaproteobacteria bacterium]
MAQLRTMASLAPWIAGAGLSLAACSGSSAPLPAPGDPITTPDGPNSPPGTIPADGTPLAGTAKSLETPPPPLAGGTLLMLRDGRTAVASDPDRDMIFVADVQKKTVVASVPTKAGAQPGRAIEDSDGNVHVVLREQGSVLSLKAGSWSVMAEQKVCPAPRGIAFDGSRVWVACAGGELVQAGSGGKSFTLDRDLRDVVFTNGRLLVTQFRSAKVLTVSPEDGSVLSRTSPPGSRESQQLNFKMAPPPNGTDAPSRAADPVVAWRMRLAPNGGAVVMHQEATTSPLGLEQGGYGGGPCKGGAISAAVTTISKDGSVSTSGSFSFATLPVDIDVSPDGRRLAMIFAGNNGQTPTGPVAVMSAQSVEQGQCIFPHIENPPPPDFGGTGGGSGMGGQGGGNVGGAGGAEEELPPPDIINADFRNKQPVAVAFARDGNVIVQSREPAVLTVLGRNGGDITLSKLSREDSGQRVFHMSTSAGLACASCHPEGGDDGRVWEFQKIGSRRTQNLRGGIVNLAPFHWDGDMKDLGTLMTEVFGGRMQGPRVDGPHLKALAHFMDNIKELPAQTVADKAAVDRGRLLFNDSKVGCATCHTGPMFTNNATVDVGTGKAFQVPTLKGLAGRAPYMHTGCAKTLGDRFTASCGGGDKHGVTSHLSTAQLADLTAFLETL